MDCPVCQRQNVPPEFSGCPQCDTDLRGLRLLESLRISAAQPVTSPPSISVRPAAKRPAWVLPALLGVVMLTVGVVAGRIGALPNTPSPASQNAAQALPDTQSASAVYKDSLALLHQQIAAIQTLKQGEKAASGFVYVVRKGDTLNGIAWRLYGRAELAEQLRQLNQIADPRRLPIGKSLRLMSI